MKYIIRIVTSVLALLVGVVAFAQCLSTSSLTTFYAQNNGQAGQQFDVVAIQDVEICRMDVNMYTGTHQYQIYTKAGTHVGFEANAAAWNLIGGPVAITSNGTNVATPVPIPINLTILAGNTGAIYFTCNRTLTPGGGNRYTNGTAVGNVLAANTDIRILEGTGKAWSFGSNYKPREFNGTLYYDVIATLPVELLSFTGKNMDGENHLDWSTASELNASSFIVQRSIDGSYYENLTTIPAAGNSNVQQFYHYIDQNPKPGVNYYRLKQVDVDGKKEYSHVIAVSEEEIKEFAINKLYPNPAQNELIMNLFSEHESPYLIRIVDVTGRPVMEQYITPRKGVSNMKLDVSALTSGLYSLSIQSEQQVLQNERFLKQ